MATQVYVKKGKGYTARLTLGSDVDQVSGVYQVFVSLSHEWGDPISVSTRLADVAVAGDETLDLEDASVFSIGDYIGFHSGTQEHHKITDIVDNLVTLDTPVGYTHNLNSRVVKETVATRDDVGKYSYAFPASDLASSGKHKIRWTYIQSSVEFHTEQYVNVYTEYISAAEFFDAHPELETEYDDSFDSLQRRVANIINTYCGQTFDSYPDKRIIFDGSGYDSLHTGLRVYNINEAWEYPDLDITSYIRIAPSSYFFINILSADIDTPSKFSTKKQYEIRGDWGWPSVPTNITQAAELLLVDEMNNDTNYVKHGVVRAEMDMHRLEFTPGIFESTGNLDADILLMDYTLLTIGVI